MIIKLICLCIIVTIAYILGWYTGKNEEKKLFIPFGRSYSCCLCLCDSSFIKNFKIFKKIANKHLTT